MNNNNKINATRREFVAFTSSSCKNAMPKQCVKHSKTVNVTINVSHYQMNIIALNIELGGGEGKNQGTIKVERKYGVAKWQEGTLR